MTRSSLAFCTIAIALLGLIPPAASYLHAPEGYDGSWEATNELLVEEHSMAITIIPLWPGSDKIPGERPGVFGNESMKCVQSEEKNHLADDCKDRAIYNVTVPILIPYLVPNSDSAVIVAPGGGYGLLMLDREGIDIATWLNQIGISAFVLKYRVPGRSWLPFGQAPLMDAQRAMGVVRHMAHDKNSPLPNLNPSKIGFMGFSAGGHLTGHINVAWANRSYPHIDAADQESCRPDFSIMVYPWRSVSQPPVNEPISGASALNVTNTTPPTLLIQTEDDPVYVENSLFYYLALKQKGASPSELHVYPRGGHGYGRCTIAFNVPPKNRNAVCSWPDRAQIFLQALKIISCTEKGTAARVEETE